MRSTLHIDIADSTTYVHHSHLGSRVPANLADKRARISADNVTGN